MPVELQPIDQPVGLVTPERAVQNAKLAALPPESLQSLLLAASDAIKQATGRTFGLTAYREYTSGANYPGEALRLSQYPVVLISRIAFDRQPALRISNTNQTLNQRATVATTAQGVVLYRMASGVPQTVTLPYADNVTLDAMATAINGAGGGWQATVAVPYGQWPSADLRGLQGAMSVIGAADTTLDLYTEDLTLPWRLDAAAGILWGSFPAGHENIRIDYTAGYDSVPEAIQEACLQMAQYLSQAAGMETAIKSRSIGPYSETFGDLASMSGRGLPPNVAALVASYVDHSRLVSIV